MNKVKQRRVYLGLANSGNTRHDKWNITDKAYDWMANVAILLWLLISIVTVSLYPNGVSDEVMVVTFVLAFPLAWFPLVLLYKHLNKKRKEASKLYREEHAQYLINDLAAKGWTVLYPEDVAEKNYFSIKDEDGVIYSVDNLWFSDNYCQVTAVLYDDREITVVPTEKEKGLPEELLAEYEAEHGELPNAQKELFKTAVIMAVQE